MRKSMFKISMLAAALFSFTEGATAEVIKGSIKGIDPESGFFSMFTGKEQVTVVSWDSRTSWKGLSGFSALMIDENLTVALKSDGNIPLATSVLRKETPVPSGINVMAFDQVTANIAKGDLNAGFTLVDTRAVELYEAGHIPGAISAPLARLEKRALALLPENRDSRLVFYDEGVGGESAGKAAAISLNFGFKDVAVFADGATGWIGAGKVLASSTSFIRKRKPVLIDIRSKRMVEQEHITGAVNFPLSMLDNCRDRMETDKLEPVVVYGDSDMNAVSAARTIMKWGFRRVTFYPGGVSSWRDSAEVTGSGPAREQINSNTISHSGALKSSDFKMALISKVMVEIVDVRSVQEQLKGSFPQATKIFLKELPKRAAELNRDKIQVVFAADRFRAELAYDYLKSKGYRVNYLNGTVLFEKDGTYQLTDN